MIAVQVKARHDRSYTGETEDGFTYLLKGNDLAYWSGSNLPVIVVLYRVSDHSFYWQAVGKASGGQDRRLLIDKVRDRLDANAKDRLANLTVPKAGFGHYIPPLGGGEEVDKARYRVLARLVLGLPPGGFAERPPRPRPQVASLLFTYRPRLEREPQKGLEPNC